jgi:hypothetical protein
LNNDLLTMTHTVLLAAERQCTKGSGTMKMTDMVREAISASDEFMRKTITTVTLVPLAALWSLFAPNRRPAQGS